jgi:hypothetical protein
VTLSLDRAPQVGDEVGALLTILAVRPSPGTTATLMLPPSVNVASGQVDWKGDLEQDKPVELRSVLRFTAPGQLEITGRSLRMLDNGDIWGDQAVLYLDVRQPGEPPSQVTATPPPAQPAD